MRNTKGPRLKILDCQSIESTYQSLEDILGIKESHLHKLFDSVDIYDSSWSYIEPVRRLFSYVRRETHCKVDFDASCFFHCTRTRSSNTFDEGLLPLDQMIDKIWDFLFDLTEGQVISQQWADFRHSMQSNNSHWADLYRMKLADASLHGGPHAFLIRETTIKGIKDKHYVNYFRIPEIVEDICYCCPYNINLRHKFIANTVPCIVKFIDYTDSKTALRTAMIYAYHKYRNLELSLACNGGFSGKGVQVPKDVILKVEFLPEGIKSS